MAVAILGVTVSCNYPVLLSFSAENDVRSQKSELHNHCRAKMGKGPINRRRDVHGLDARFWFPPVTAPQVLRMMFLPNSFFSLTHARECMWRLSVSTRTRELRGRAGERS